MELWTINIILLKTKLRYYQQLPEAAMTTDSSEVLLRPVAITKIDMRPCVLCYFLIASISCFNATSGLDFLANDTQDPPLQIKLLDGIIQGKLKHTVDIGIPYHSYEGIPYAKPPVGELRFRPPQPPEKWNGVLDANGKVPICIQIPPNGREWLESEDCLYINVYVPKPPENSSQLLPVMVWIYGGGFLFGQAVSSYYGPDYLVQQNVVVVHFNYRVNVFGFLSTGDLAAPGNYGLKDQVAALRWVRNNIQFFGGDPQKVTIFGESAGGASVQYHLLSPKSQGLFQRAISESGSVLCPWALQTNPMKIAHRLGSASGKVARSSEELVAHLKSLTTYKLRKAAIRTSILNSVNVVAGLPFSPTLEPEHSEAFVSRRSFELLQNGEFAKVPYIIGFNSQESAVIQPALELLEPLLRLVRANPELLVPPGMGVDPGETAQVGEEIKQFYFTNSNSRTRQYLEFISDSYFYRPITKSASLYALHAPVYLYRFSYEGYFLGRRAFELCQDQHINGVMHAEEVWYLFARSDLPQANDTDKLIRTRMVELWTNFAKYGNPTPTPTALLEHIAWPTAKTDDLPYLDINYSMSVKSRHRGEAMEFWNGLYKKYGRSPFDTY